MWSATIRLMIRFFRWFFQQETASGLLLFVVAVVAIAWANSPWEASYFDCWQMVLGVGAPGAGVSLTVHEWINDALMALFFLLVGLEMKHEWVEGSLSSPKEAALPVLAAVGGMLVPGILYAGFNPPGTPFQAGWGIPMVTDIAFSLGVLALLGSRVPLFLKVFLTALAVVDDLGAIVMIALFYAKSMQWSFLGAAAGVFGVLLCLNRWGLRRLPVYLWLGALLWVCFLFSGVHATLAGVLLAWVLPSGGPRSRLSRTLLKPIRSVVSLVYTRPASDVCTASWTLAGLENRLRPWVNFVILPLFALANAGVVISPSVMGQAVCHPMAWGIVAGLLLGKPIGIVLFCWLGVWLKLVRLPEDSSWMQVYGVACLGGVGFTMSLFIADLAFPAAQVGLAKLSILSASICSGLWGWGVLQRVLPQRPVQPTGT